MTPQEFIRKWKPVALTERATAQEHFIDLCRLFDHPTPVEDDPVGDHFTFEKGAPKTGGGEGWADVWKKGYFAWEYKKKKRDLNAALDQLVRYAAALEIPPLQVACDTDRFLIRTAWTNAETTSFRLRTRRPAKARYSPLGLLRPGKTASEGDARGVLIAVRNRRRARHHQLEHCVPHPVRIAPIRHRLRKPSAHPQPSLRLSQ